MKSGSGVMVIIGIALAVFGGMLWGAGEATASAGVGVTVVGGIFFAVGLLIEFFMLGRRLDRICDAIQSLKSAAPPDQADQPKS